MASYTIVTATAANVAGSNNINSTKVKVMANNACYFAINQPATASANVGSLIVPNSPNYINMTGIGNKLSVLPTGGASTAITLTECGTVYQRALDQNTITLVATLQANTVVLMTSTAGLKTGMYVSGYGVPNNTTISAITADTSVTLTGNVYPETGDRTLNFTVNQIQTA